MIEVKNYEARVSVKEAAERMGCSEMAVRMGLRCGRLPIGYAQKLKDSNTRYFYFISRKLLNEYLGETTEV